jgi:hypothetical protein
MPQIGQSLGVAPPAVGTAGPGFAVTMNGAVQACIDAIETGVSTSVGLTVDSNVDCAGYELQDLGALKLNNKGSSFADSAAIYIRESELWFNDSSGNQVRITLGGSLDATSLGGIGGDYGGGDPAAVVYTAVSSKYVFTQDPGVPASLETGTIRLLPLSAGGNAISITSPAPGSAYNLTLPSAPPASTSLVTMSSVGTLATTRTPSVDTVTASASMTTPTITLTDPAPRHGEATLHMHASAAQVGNAGTGANMNGQYWTTSDASGILYFPVQLAVGERIKSVSVYVRGSASAITVALMRQSATAGTLTSIASGSSSLVAADQTVNLSSLTETMTAGGAYCIQVQFAFAPSGQRVYGARVVYDRVA